MKAALTGLAMLTAVVASGITTQAHHSIVMFDLATPIWVKGSFVRLDRINPHSVMTLEERTADANTQRWAIEGPSALALNRVGFSPDLFKAGDVIDVCGFALKAEHSKPTSPVGDASSRFMHGHLLVMANGRKRMWGSYGKLQNCLRPTDQKQSWLDFLNENLGARGIWCNRWLDSTPSTAFALAFAKEITNRMATPCE